MSTQDLKQEIALTQERLAQASGAEACQIACALIALQTALINQLERQ